jgi:hypothetical protein
MAKSKYVTTIKVTDNEKSFDKANGKGTNKGAGVGCLCASGSS